MASNHVNKFAVVIGIDTYPLDKDCLDGCVNDAKAIASILESDLEIPQSQITRLLAPRQQTYDPTRSDAPTGQNVMKALRTLETKEPGAFIYFHYSGHGSQTVYNTEYLCTWGTWISDSDFGDQLDRLAKVHTLCVILDCCHSAGQDRRGHGGDLSKIRSCRYEAKWVSESSQQHQIGDPATARHPGYAQESTRDAASKSSLLYCERQYNLIAACQPRQLARERFLVSRNCSHGTFTGHFIESLEELKGLRNCLTYGEFYSVVQTRVKNLGGQSMLNYDTDGNIVHLFQDPAHFGNPDRMLFGSDFGSPTQLANIITNRGPSVKLNQGRAQGILVGDSFQVHNPGDTTSRPGPHHSLRVMEIEVFDLQDNVSIARSPENPPISLLYIKPGSFARLSKRKRNTILYVDLSEAPANLDSKEMREQLQGDKDQMFLMDVHFDRPAIVVDYVVRVKADTYAIEHGDGSPVFYLSSVPRTKSGHSRHLKALLEHLVSYFRVKDLSTTQPPLPFDFGLAEIVGDDPAFASWQFNFTNNHVEALYITVLMLGPAYGVHKLFPDDTEGCFEVGVKKTLEDYRTHPSDYQFEMHVPELLYHLYEREPVHEMTDVLKLFVTTEQTSFDHLKLCNLSFDRMDGVDRDVRRPRHSVVQHANCYILQKTIKTPLNRCYKD
jgi:hypothetical protein